MPPALKRLFSFLNKSLLLLIVIALVSLVNPPTTSRAQVEGGARCRCANPADDGCACQVTEGGSVTRNFNGVDVVCDPSVADSFFNQANPVCGNNAEVVPYCSTSYAPDLLFCWGTSFAGGISPPPSSLNSGGWIPVVPNGGTATVTFNGGSWSGISHIWTCNSSLYCCGSDTCGQEGPEYGTCPSSGGPVPESPADTACEGAAATLAGVGESRLWFSQARLVSTLSTMAQTMFNPKNLNIMYEDTAFSKMATQKERDTEEFIASPLPGHFVETSGRIDNKGSITSRIERHQGIDDSTRAVNTSNNNSSIIVGVQTPDPLTPYYPEFGDRSCFVEETFTNPGDDLIGAKMRGEMLFTKAFSVRTKGRPIQNSNLKIGSELCTDDGGSFDIPYGNQGDYGDSHCQYDCCAGAGNCTVNKWSPSGCSQVQGSTDCFTTNQIHSCLGTNSNNEPVFYCCNEPDACVPPATVSVSCGTLPEVKLPVGADANIFDKTPLIEYIQDTILDGEDSLFRRFMPDLEGIFEFEDIPSKAFFNATASVISFGTAEPGSFKLKFADGKVSAPEMYFPHLGSLYKYWLVDFQKALKPLTFSSPDQPYSEKPPGGEVVNPFDSIDCPAPRTLPDPTETGIKCVSNCNTSLSDADIENAASAAGVNYEYFINIRSPFIDLAKRWVASGGENSLAAECYNDVVVRSLRADVNPIYSLAIWLQESDASNYESNVTYCNPNDPSRTVQDFGINIPSIAGNFDAQISYFLQLPYEYPEKYSQCFGEGCNLGNFSLIYQQGIPNAQCTFNQSALSYANKTVNTMQLFSPTCVPKYPTDLETCPL